jgi:acetolactate decarboxylase
MVLLTCDVPVSLRSALKMRALATRQSESQLVIAALSQYLAQAIHSLFQVSTSEALVAGIYSGVVSCTTVLQHGDFELGTSANLDGEMLWRRAPTVAPAWRRQATSRSRSSRRVRRNLH